MGATMGYVLGRELYEFTDQMGSQRMVLGARVRTTRICRGDDYGLTTCICFYSDFDLLPFVLVMCGLDS